ALVRFTDVVVQHTGYQDAATRRRKLQRDLRLLQLDARDRPDDAYVLFNLGWNYHEQGRAAEALPLLQRSLQRSHPADSIVRKLYALLAEGHRQLGQFDRAQAACRAGRTRYPDDSELLFLDAELLYEHGQLAAAEACLQQLLQAPWSRHFASVDAGIRGYRARHLLALVRRAQGREAEAEALWRQALAEQPGFAAAWRELAELYLEQGRWPEFAQALEPLRQDPRLALEAQRLQARAQVVRGEFA